MNTVFHGGICASVGRYWQDHWAATTWRQITYHQNLAPANATFDKLWQAVDSQRIGEGLQIDNKEEVALQPLHSPLLFPQLLATALTKYNWLSCQQIRRCLHACTIDCWYIAVIESPPALCIASCQWIIILNRKLRITNLFSSRIRIDNLKQTNGFSIFASAVCSSSAQNASQTSSRWWWCNDWWSLIILNGNEDENHGSEEGYLMMTKTKKTMIVNGDEDGKFIFNSSKLHYWVNKTVLCNYAINQKYKYQGIANTEIYYPTENAFRASSCWAKSLSGIDAVHAYEISQTKSTASVHLQIHL